MIVHRPNTALLVGQMLACSFLWASSFLLMKLLGAHLSAVALTAARGAMGASLLAAWLLACRESIVPRGREWRDWIALGILQGVVPNVLTVFALTQISAGLTSMLHAAIPIVVAVLAHGLFSDERLTPRRAFGVVLGFGGIVLLLGPDAIGQPASDSLGKLAMTAAVLSYALGDLYVRSIPSAKPMRLAFGQQVFSGFPTLAAVLLAAGPPAFAGIAEAPLELALLGVFGTALPIVLYMRILRGAGPTLGSMFRYFLPPWTVLLGWVVLHETVSLREIAASAIVLAGVMTVSSARRLPGPLGTAASAPMPTRIEDEAMPRDIGRASRQG